MDFSNFSNISQILGVIASCIAAIAAAFASLNSIKNGASLKTVHMKVDALVDEKKMAMLVKHEKHEPEESSLLTKRGSEEYSLRPNRNKSA